MPAVGIAAMGFSSGGYFPAAVARGTAAAAICIALITLAAPARVRRPPVLLGVMATSGVLFAVWVLASAKWSDAAGRSLIEFDRAVLYALTAVGAGLLVRTPHRLRWMLGLAAIALVATTGAALASRLLPREFPTELVVAPGRLSYPLSYWNGLGLLAAMALVSCLHFSADLASRPAVRCVAAAALPVCATTLALTYSRAALGAAAVGLVLYLVIARPRGAPAALVAALPTIFALSSAYHAEALASPLPASPLGVAQGRDVLEVLIISVGVTVILRALLLFLDVRVARLRIPSPRRGFLPAVVVVGALVGAGVMLVVGSAPIDRLRVAVQREAHESPVDARERLGSVGSAARFELWRVALDEFAREPIHGRGAGSFATSYQRLRERPSDANEGHSLVIETLGEFGVVGLALLGLMLGSGVVGAALCARGPVRPVFGLVLATTAAWFAGAAIDWHWECPAVTLWPVAALGAAAGVPRGCAGLWTWAPRWWVRLIPALTMAAVLPFAAAVVQSEKSLERSITALRDGRPVAALEAANRSRAALPQRAEPFELAAYALVLLNEPTRAIASARAAVSQEPRDWEQRYALALVQAAAGQDPTPALRAARRRNPFRLEPVVLLGEVQALRRPRAAAFRRLARAAPLVLGQASAPLRGGLGPPAKQ